MAYKSKAMQKWAGENQPSSVNNTVNNGYKSSAMQNYEAEMARIAQQEEAERQKALIAQQEAEAPRRATLKDLTLGSIGRGYATSKYGNERYDEIMLGTDRQAKQAQKAKEKTEQEKYNFAAQSKAGQAISGAGELIGQQIYNFTNKDTLGAVGANVAGAAAVGAAIPLPEEIVTMPTAVARGLKLGTAATMYQISAAQAYDEMIEAGVSEKTAKTVANVIGAGMGALEGIQADELLKSAKILKGVKGEASEKALSNIMKALGKLGVSTAIETGEEVAQEAVSMVGQDYAKKKEGLDTYTPEEYKQRLKDTAVQSALSFGVLGGLGAVGGAVANRNNLNTQTNDANSANNEAENTPKRAINSKEDATDTNVVNTQPEIAPETAVANETTKDSRQSATQQNGANPLSVERYGEEGKKAFALVQNDPVKTAEFDKFYQEGLLNKQRPTETVLSKNEATAAYMAGMKDGQTNRTAYAQKQYTVNKEAGLDKKSAENVSLGDRIVYNTIGKAFGKKVVVVPTLKNADGTRSNAKIDLANGIIYIAQDAQNGGRVALAHEVVHDMRVAAPAEFDNLARLVTDYHKRFSKYDSKFADTAKLYELDKGKIDYYDMMEEMVADFIADNNGAERIVDMLSTDKPLAQKFIDSVKKVVVQLGKLALDKETRKIVNEWEDLVKQLEKTVKSTEAKAKTTSYPADAKVGGFTVSETRDSLKSAKYDLEQGEMVQDLITHKVFSSNKAENNRMVHQFVENLNKLIDNVITPNATIFDMQEDFGKDDRRYTSYKNNSDPLYKLSLDFSTLCKKRLMSQYVTEQLQLKLGKAITAEEQLALRDRLLELRKENEAIEVACALCYVEAARLKSPTQINRFLKDRTGYMTKYFAKANKEFDAKVKELQRNMKVERGYDADATISKLPQKDRDAINNATRKMRMAYKPSAEELDIIEIAKSLDDREFLTLGNLEKMADEHPDIYKAFASHVASSTRSKELQDNTAYYYGDSKREGLTDNLITLMNAENGLRHQSWSDFQSVHLLDTIIAIADLSVRGAKMQAYTKVPNFVKLVGKTGMMLNLSLIPEGRTGFINGKLGFSNVEGMDFEIAKQLRDTYPDTVGTIAIGINEQQIKAMLASADIDYVIPYHASGLNKGLRQLVKLESWKDFQSKQSEKKIEGYANLKNNPDWHKKPDFSEWFKIDEIDTSKDGVEIMREAAKRYKELCRERGLSPKFEAYKDEDNYWKLLIDRKMVNHKTGKIIEQQAVKPIFDFDVIETFLNEEAAQYDATLNDRLLEDLMAFYGDGGRTSDIAKRKAQLKKEGKIRADMDKKGIYDIHEQFPAIDFASAIESPFKIDKPDVRESKMLDKNADEDYNNVKGGAEDENDSGRIGRTSKENDSFNQTRNGGQDFGLLRSTKEKGKRIVQGRQIKGNKNFDGISQEIEFENRIVQYDSTPDNMVSKVAKEVAKELELLGVDYDIYSSKVIIDTEEKNTVYENISTGAITLINGFVLINNRTNLPPKEVASHEAFHSYLRKGNSYAEEYFEELRYNFINNEEAQSYVVDLCERYNETHDTDIYDIFENAYAVQEEISAFLCGNIYNRDLKSISVIFDFLKDPNIVVKRCYEFLNDVNTDSQNKIRYSKMSEPNIPEGYKERGLAESTRTKSTQADEVKQDFIDNPDFYKQLANKTTREKAEAILAKGLSFAEAEFPKLLERMDAVAVPLADMMAKEYSKMGEHDKASNIIREAGQRLTKAGQFSQAAAIMLLKHNPMAALAYAQRDIDKLNVDGKKRFGSKWKDFELTDAETEMFKNIKEGDAEGIKKAYETINKRLAKEYPSTFWQKFIETSRISMLLNPRTNVKNVVSNLLLYPVTRGSGILSSKLQKAYSYYNKDYKPNQSGLLKKEIRTQAEKVWENIKDTLETTNKYNEGIKANGRDIQVFKEGIGTRVVENIAPGTLHKLNTLMGKEDAGLMETMRNATYWFLEVGDNIFVKQNFISRFGSYMQAKGITDINSMSEEDMASAIEVAYREALRATFKDDTALSKWLANIKHTGNPYIDALMEMVMPFTKTPANIAMRGIDYSPVGIINTISKARKGADASEVIDELSKNLLGSALIAFGAWLFSKGLVTGGEPENEKQAAFLKQQGWLPYAVKVGDRYVTYDWAQPAAIPVIMGVTMMESLEEGRLGVVDAVKNAGVASFNQWIELSPLQSLQEVMGGYGTVGENLLNTAIEMPQRLIPSALGATARTADTTQRVTYSKGNVAQTQKDIAKSKIPGASQTLPVAYDTWGNAKQRDDSTLGAAFNQYINPSSAKLRKQSEVDLEIDRLYESLGDEAVYPRKADYIIKKDGKTYQLDNKDYSEYQRIMGELSYDGVRALMDSKSYDSLTDYEKGKIIEKIYSNAFETAKYAILESKGYEKTSADVKDMQETKIKKAYMDYNANNIAEYYIAHQIFNNAESDKTKSGVTIAGSKKKNGINRLVELGYTKSEAKRLYERMNGD